MSRRLLMLALDSIDWFLVNEWAAEGHLPVLRRRLDDHARLHRVQRRKLPASVRHRRRLIDPEAHRPKAIKPQPRRDGDHANQGDDAADSLR